MDLNPVFTDTTKFRPAGPSGSGGLELFSHARISLVHGWLVDPESQEYDAIEKSGDYDSSVNIIVEVDHLTQGYLVVDVDTVEAGPSTGRPSNSLTPELKARVDDGKHLRIH
jgi:ubiquitin carboxyl-terminal hydrolase MINDY-1/2